MKNHKNREPYETYTILESILLYRKIIGCDSGKHIYYHWDE